MAVQPAIGPSLIKSQRGSPSSASTWRPATRPSVRLPVPSIRIPTHFVASSSDGRSALSTALTSSVSWVSLFDSAIALLHQLRGGARRIELALHHAIEQLLHGGVIGDRRLELPAHPRRGQLQHLVPQVAGPALLERAL